MGSLILCNKKRAKQPYEISRIHIRIYTIEELCYYISNNLYLIDYTIMNRRLCNWIDDELSMTDLAEKLRLMLDQNASLEEFVLAILRGAYLYSPSEIAKTSSLLAHLKNQKDVEKAKYKADSLLKTEEYASANLIYQTLINQDWDDSVERGFYGQIYNNAGVAYGRMFLYKEAAAMFKKAYEILEDPDVLRAYLYCCYRYLPEAEYTKMLSGNRINLGMASIIKEDIRMARKEINTDFDRSLLKNWEKEYRKTGTPEGI